MDFRSRHVALALALAPERVHRVASDMLEGNRIARICKLELEEFCFLA